MESLPKHIYIDSSLQGFLQNNGNLKKKQIKTLKKNGIESNFQLGKKYIFLNIKDCFQGGNTFLL